MTIDPTRNLSGEVLQGRSAVETQIQQNKRKSTVPKSKHLMARLHRLAGRFDIKPTRIQQVTPFKTEKTKINKFTGKPEKFIQFEPEEAAFIEGDVNKIRPRKQGFTSDIKNRLAGLIKAAVVTKPRGVIKDRRVRKITNFLTSPGQTKRFVSQPPKPESKAINQFIEKGTKINPSKFKGKTFTTDLQKRLASLQKMSIVRKPKPSFESRRDKLPPAKGTTQAEENARFQFMEHGTKIRPRIKKALLRPLILKKKKPKRIKQIKTKSAVLTSEKIQAGEPRDLTGPDIVKRFKNTGIGDVEKGNGFTFLPDEGRVTDALKPVDAQHLRTKFKTPSNETLSFVSRSNNKKFIEDIQKDLEGIKAEGKTPLVGGFNFPDERGLEVDATFAMSSKSDLSVIEELQKTNQQSAIAIEPDLSIRFIINPKFKNKLKGKL